MTFRENAIDVEILPELTEADLKRLGVIIGHRKRMLRAIAALGTRPEAGPAVVPSAQGAERRQLTVMFCDFVGSTALSARLDPEDLREVLGGYHACVAEVVKSFGGFVARYMGDGALIYFGYPHAHEDDAEQALRAGLSLVDRIARLELTSGKVEGRVGIATGLVVVGDLIRGGGAGERNVVGETPNLAARLQGLGAPGAVLIAESTRRLAGELFEYRSLGALEVKGFAEPVPVWEVLRQSEVESRFEALRAASLTPLVGREEEAELLLRRWEQAKASEGQIVLLSGEPGIGKSRIATALQNRIQDEPHIRLRYFCSPPYRGSPLHPFIAQLQRAAGFTRADASQTKLGKLEALLSQSGESSAEIAALFADLLGVPNDGRYPGLPADPVRRRALMFSAMMRQLEGLGRTGPVLMIFEDAHWIDSTSLELLEMIVDRLAPLPVLFVLTFRPEFQPPWIGQAHVTTLALSRLGRGATAMLAEGVAGGKALPAEILDQIIARADGIPLFIEELTKTLLEGSLLREQNGRYFLDGPLPPLAIPSSLHASLLARLDRLAPVREVAQIGAAIGREFSCELLAAVAGRSEDYLGKALDRLADAGLVFRAGAQPPQPSFIFKHALIQDAAYSTLLRGQRKELHARIGKVLEGQFPETVGTQPEILAHHFTQAGLADIAIDYWRKAGERAIARSANAEAIKHLTNGRALIPSLPAGPERDQREFSLHLALGTAMWAVKGPGSPETLRAFSRARDLLGDRATAKEKLTVAYGLWGVHLLRSEHRAGCELAEQCLALAAREEDPEGAALGNRIMGLTLWAMGAFIRARHCLERTFDFCLPGQTDLRFWRDNAISAQTYLGVTLLPLGYPEQAAAAVTDALTAARGLGHATTIGNALYADILLAGAFGTDPQRAARRADETAAYSLEHGLTLYLPWARFYQGVSLARRGDPRHGIEVMRAALEAADKINAELLRPIHLGHLAAAHSSAGQAEVALDLLDEAIRTADETDEGLFEAELYRMRGELLLGLGVKDQAEAALERALAVARGQEARMWELRSATSLARLWRDQGRQPEARDLLAPVYGWFTEGFDTPDLKGAKALLDELG